MRVSRLLKPAFAGLSILALAACGGGAAATSSSGAAPASSVAAPASAAAAPASSGPASAGSNAASAGSRAASAGSSAAPASASGSTSAPASAAASVQPSASSAASANGQLTKLKVAYPQVSAVDTPLFLAADQGFFKKYGLDISLSKISGTAEVPALTANEVQFAAPGGNELIDANLGGASLVMVSTFSNYPVFSLFTQKNITKPEQLVGKSIAVTTPGSSTAGTAEVYLNHFGLSGKVKIQPAGSIQGVLALMEQNGAAGGIMSPPTNVEAAKAGFYEMVNGPKLRIPEVHAGLVVTDKYLKANPDIVKRFLQADLEGWTFCADKANEAAVVKTIGKWTKTNDTIAKQSYDYIYPIWSGQKVPTVDPKGIQSLEQVSKNPKAKSLDPNSIIDNSILESLSK